MNSFTTFVLDGEMGGSGGGCAGVDGGGGAGVITRGPHTSVAASRGGGGQPSLRGWLEGDKDEWPECEWSA